MTREEQLLLIRRDAPLALNRVVAMIETYRDDILAHTRSRVDAGYDIYGTEGWRKAPHDLDQDTIEELADAVAYQVMRRHRLRHPDPS
jgi:hypothetical protein